MNNKSIKIPFSQSDLEDLINGEEFDWTFTAQNGEGIDVHIYNEDIE